MEKSTETKADIRARALKLRAEIGQTERRKAEQEIKERLIGASFYEEAHCIYCYASFRDEVGTRAIIEESLKQGKKVAVPRVIGRRKMAFFFIKSMADLRPGAWSIPEPGPWCKKAPLPGSDTLVILPGAAFDRSGARVGYGGGFYDLYLAGNEECRRVALAFSVQCAGEIPKDVHDVCVEMIITEKELIRCSQDYPETR